jgi:hypothetical protein
MIDLFGQEPNGAIFSEDRKYRFVLWRIWNYSKPKIMFIGLNPSTANETDPDNTISRLVGLVKKWGYGGFYMLNLFTYITPHPEELINCSNPLLLSNEYLLEYSEKAEIIVFAWGNFKQAKERAKEVISMFPDAFCIIKNKDGSPRHPLYVPANVELIKF